MIVIACDYCTENIEEPDFIGIDTNDARNAWVVDFIPIKSPKDYDIVLCNKECLIGHIQDKCSLNSPITITFNRSDKIQES